jgi:hypothetical protein
MPRKISEPTQRERDLQALLEAIQTGAIEEVDELSEADRALLLEALGRDEDIQALFDRLSGSSGGDR